MGTKKNGNWIPSHDLNVHNQVKMRFKIFFHLKDK
jgi:hypothetical protein